VDLARRVERAEIGFCALAGSASLPSGISSFDVAGGTAIYVAPGSPLNKVLGLGVGEAVSDHDIDALCEFYRQHASPAQVELCPLTARDLAGRLCARGFVPQGFENELACGLGESRPVARPGRAADHIRVSRTTPEEDPVWIRVVAEGFAVGEGARPDAIADAHAVGALGEMMQLFTHPAIRRYLAWMGGTPVGGGATYVHDRTVGVFGTATLPRFRGRGVQTALVARGLEEAAGQADLAISTTEPGSTSQRTFERIGFQVLYTRLILVKG
jgi:GNAT superfamily N-acetyltransferase